MTTGAKKLSFLSSTGLSLRDLTFLKRRQLSPSLQIDLGQVPKGIEMVKTRWPRVETVLICIIVLACFLRRTIQVRRSPSGNTKKALALRPIFPMPMINHANRARSPKPDPGRNCRIPSRCSRQSEESESTGRISRSRFYRRNATRMQWLLFRAAIALFSQLIQTCGPILVLLWKGPGMPAEARQAFAEAEKRRSVWAILRRSLEIILEPFS